MSDKRHHAYGNSARALIISAARSYGVLIAFIILFVAVAFASPSFVSPKNFSNILTQWTPVGLMAVGETYVIIAGGFDLSMTSGFALCAITAAALATNGVAPGPSLFAAVVMGLAIGVVNGLLVAGLRVNPFIATLGSGFILLGVPHLVVDRTYIMVRQPGFDALGTGGLFGISNPAICLIAFTVLAGVVLSRTPYGQSLYAVGGNREISRLFGIRVRLVTASTYIFSGLCVGTAAAFSTSRLSYSASDQDPGLLFDVIVAVVLGGTSLGGGVGSIWRTALGLAVLAVLQNGLNLLQVNSAAQYLVKGFIIVGALAFDAWGRRVDAAPNRRRWLAEAATPEAAAELASTTSSATTVARGVRGD